MSEASTSPGSTGLPADGYKASRAPVNRGGNHQRRKPQVAAQEIDHATTQPTHPGAKEVPPRREDLTQRSPANATSEPSVNLALSAEDVQTLLKLRDAGLIQLDGLEMANHDPKLTDWTYEEFLRHMVTVQKLRARTSQGRDSTARQRVRYITFLEEHDVVPVQLRPPDEESWLDHVQYRMDEEGKSGTTLNQYRKAVKSLLKFLGINPWQSLDTAFDETPPHWTLPGDETVRRFWIERLHEDDYLNAVYTHLFHYGFNMGVRPPSELVSLNVDDVDFRGRTVHVRQVKKGGKVLPRDDVPAFVLDAPNAKSLRNYLDNWRPRVDKSKSDAFFLNTQGRRFNVCCLGSDLSEIGKRIWPRFSPYTMRRWFATKFLIANDFNLYATAHQLGDTAPTVERHYLDKAKARAAMKGRFRMERVRGGSRR